jgi:hypothetical protein
MKKKKTPEPYESPQAIHLTDKDRAFGACDQTGSTPTPVGYRVNGFEGVCVTGKAASSGCYAGVGCAVGASV